MSSRAHEWQVQNSSSCLWASSVKEISLSESTSGLAISDMGANLLHQNHQFPMLGSPWRFCISWFLEGGEAPKSAVLISALALLQVRAANPTLSVFLSCLQLTAVLSSWHPCPLPSIPCQSPRWGQFVTLGSVPGLCALLYHFLLLEWHQWWLIFLCQLG